MKRKIIYRERYRDIEIYMRDNILILHQIFKKLTKSSCSDGLRQSVTQF